VVVSLAFCFEAWFEAMALRSGLCKADSDGERKVGLSSTRDAVDHSVTLLLGVYTCGLLPKALAAVMLCQLAALWVLDSHVYSLCKCVLS
jgi:organic hydroperoxide reductase OsmC/OhrA